MFINLSCLRLFFLHYSSSRFGGKRVYKRARNDTLGFFLSDAQVLSCGTRLDFREYSIEIRIKGKFASVGFLPDFVVVATWICFVERPWRRRDGRSAGALTPACKSSGPALPASAIQKKSFFCVVTPRPSPAAGSPGPAWQHLPPSRPLPRVPLARSRHFPGFSFHFAPSSSSPGLPFRAPFFPGTSLSTRLTPPLVVYLESSITCT